MFFLGRISKSRGNRGEVIFHVSPEIDVYSIDFSGTLKLKSKKHLKEAKMESYSLKGSSVIAKFNISNSINDALKLVGYDVYIPASARDNSIPELDGYEVFDIAGIGWGKVTRTDFSGPNRLIEVYNGSKHIMVPFAESIVIEIDEDKKRIVLDPPEGLIDLN